MPNIFHAFTDISSNKNQKTTKNRNENDQFFIATHFSQTYACCWNNIGNQKVYFKKLLTYLVICISSNDFKNYFIMTCSGKANFFFLCDLRCSAAKYFLKQYSWPRCFKPAGERKKNIGHLIADSKWVIGQTQGKWFWNIGEFTQRCHATSSRNETSRLKVWAFLREFSDQCYSWCKFLIAILVITCTFFALALNEEFLSLPVHATGISCFSRL